MLISTCLCEKAEASQLTQTAWQSNFCIVDIFNAVSLT